MLLLGSKGTVDKTGLLMLSGFFFYSLPVACFRNLQDSRSFINKQKCRKQRMQLSCKRK